jgi:hypothetical protein
MTHDELTIRIIKLSEDDTVNWKLYPALRAAVDLHKPIEGYEHLCSACWFGDGMMSYPCPTIQAITEKLQ